MRRSATLVVGLLAAAAAVAAAGDGAALQAAKALAAKGDWLKAAERFGDAVAAAQKAGDLQAEEEAADEFAAFIDGVPDAPAPDAKAPRPPSRGAVLAATMRKLDPARSGAFVSAPTLARAVLEQATESGDFAAVADAAKTASLAAAKPSPGGAAPVVAKYAEGLRAVAEGRLDDACPALESAATAAGKAAWFGLATHAATELAAARVRQGAPEKAAAAIAATAAVVDGTVGTELPEAWLEMAKRRCPGAPADLTKPIEDLVAKSKAGTKGGRSASAGGGSGGAVSPIGKLLPKWPKGKPFVSIARGAAGFEIAWATKPGKQPVEFPGRMSQVVEGGVTLGLLGRSAALMSVELGEASGVAIAVGSASPARAFYLLAEGETMGVTKDGLVVISR